MYALKGQKEKKSQICFLCITSTTSTHLNARFGASLSFFVRFCFWGTSGSTAFVALAALAILIVCLFVEEAQRRKEERVYVGVENGVSKKC